jgi:hypothetical protein
MPPLFFDFDDGGEAARPIKSERNSGKKVGSG